jgi:hypothetical protein
VIVSVAGRQVSGLLVLGLLISCLALTAMPTATAPTAAPTGAPGQTPLAARTATVLSATATPALATLTSATSDVGVTTVILRTSMAAGGGVPRYGMFEVAFDIAETTATNPYLPYDENTPPGVSPATGISVDALYLAPGETDWSQARTAPCFYYQPVEEVGSAEQAALLPVGQADWRCRFAPDIVGEWRYKVRVRDGNGLDEGDRRAIL